MTNPDPIRMEEAVAAVRMRMEQAARSAGRDPGSVLLCAVCKTQSDEIVRQSALLPVDCFGENHMQELVAHGDAGAFLDKPVHFIGHLQTNKVKKVVGRASMIQSVDSLRLLDAIEKEAAKQGLTQDILLELNLAEEASKTGASADELLPMLEHAAALPHIRVRGLMGIPPATSTETDNRRFFAALRRLFEDSRERSGLPFDTLSMGMSSSFEAAILEGATIVRVGSAIYGARDYNKK